MAIADGYLVGKQTNKKEKEEEKERKSDQRIKYSKTG
jgi:hypothetical protein